MSGFAYYIRVITQPYHDVFRDLNLLQHYVGTDHFMLIGFRCCEKCLCQNFTQNTEKSMSFAMVNDMACKTNCFIPFRFGNANELKQVPSRKSGFGMEINHIGPFLLIHYLQ